MQNIDDTHDPVNNEESTEIEKTNKHLYKFEWVYGRGSLEGLFVATQQEVDSIIGEEAYFGEVIGKHMEVSGEINEGDIEKLDLPPKLIEEVSEYLGDTWCGFNPLDYVETYCEKCKGEEKASEWDCFYREEFDETLCDDCFEERNSEQ